MILHPTHMGSGVKSEGTVQGVPKNAVLLHHREEQVSYKDAEAFLSLRIGPQAGFLLQTQGQGRLLCSKSRHGSMEVTSCGLTYKLFFSVRAKLNLKAKVVWVCVCAEVGLKLATGEWGRRSLWCILVTWFKASFNPFGKQHESSEPRQSQFWRCHQDVHAVPRDTSSFCTTSP